MDEKKITCRVCGEVMTDDPDAHYHMVACRKKAAEATLTIAYQTGASLAEIAHLEQAVLDAGHTGD